MTKQRRSPSNVAHQRHMRFAAEYIVDLNGTQAAIRAGYSPKTAWVQGSKLLHHPTVRDEIQRLMDERAKDVGLDAKKALQVIWERATADPRELIQVKVGSCRYCHGAGHQYQRTMVELNQAREKWLNKGQDPEAFDEAGGPGFNPNMPPHPDCPECHGDGESRVVLKDTRNISPGAAALFAGAKQTKYGIEVALHDQGKHLEMAGRHLKLFTDKIEVEVGSALAERIERARENAAGRR